MRYIMLLKTDVQKMHSAMVGEIYFISEQTLSVRQVHSVLSGDISSLLEIYRHHGLIKYVLCVVLSL